MRLLKLLSFLFLLGLATAGWAWGWREHRRAATAGGTDDFTSRRLAFLEAENARLNGYVAEKARAEVLAADRAQRAEIERTIAAQRELKFLRPVAYREIPRADLPKVLEQKLAQQTPDQEFAEMSVTYGALGLLPAGTNLKKVYLALLGEQIGAFYDQHTRELFTFSGQPLSNSQNRIILAHELTHALQDQHFDLARLPLEAKGNDDRAIAASALVEGDATLAMNVYMATHLTPGMFRDTLASAFTTDVRQLVAAPRFLRETLLFPYLHGQEFCQTLFNQGGWPEISQAYARPPSSTAQILHPEKFLAEPREEPLEIQFPGGGVVEGQKPIMDNVLGEFGARQLFANWLHDDARAADAAAGWRGDRYLIYGDAKASSYVWKAACADEAAARKFAGAAQACFAARYHVAPPPADAPATCAQAKGRELRTCVTAAHEAVIIDAQDAKWSAALADRFTPGIHYPQP